MVKISYVKINELLNDNIISTITPSLKLKNEDLSDEGINPVVSQDKQFIIGYTDLKDDRLVNVPYIIFGDHTEIIKYIDFPFVQGADGIKILKVNSDKLDSMYLYYALKGCYYPTGFYERHFKLLKKTYIPDFNYDYQIKIAKILGNYDKLIENNNHRIRLLETMAEELYKEWFVRFRFPGYKKVKFENGMPKYWRVEKLGKYVTIKRGGSPRPIQEYLAEEGLNWLKISDVTNLISPFIFKIQEKIKQEGLNKTVFLKVGSLVLSNSATPCIPKILCVDSCIHDGWLYFENSYFSNEYLTLFFQQERTNIMKLGNGAIFTNLKTDIVKNYRVIIPKKEIIEEFQTIIQPCFDKMKVMEKQNEILIKQRDYLLPRLMSGKLSVKNKNII